MTNTKKKVDQHNKTQKKNTKNFFIKYFGNIWKQNFTCF